MNIRLVLLAGPILLFVRPAFAQSRDPFFTDFSANYDIVYHEPNSTSNAGAHFDVASTLKRDVPFVGPVGDIGFNHFDGGTVANVMGGLRIRANTAYNMLPFAQGLIGLYHCGACATNDFALQLGGGVDFRTGNPMLRVRVQVDYRRVFDSFHSFNGARFSAGIVLPLNK
jgi:hypothetical protein